MKAIISVSDKTGVQKFAQGLRELGVELYSTGGTQKSLEEAHIAVKSISELTGFPEIMDGRVKTLHPAIHGGILARRDVASHISQAKAHKIEMIDMVVVNLYPFVKTVEKEGVTEEEAIENIDIGGPTMIRAAAKNFPSVLVVVDPADYQWVLEKMGRQGLSIEERKKLAQKAFQHVAVYDTAVAQYLRRGEEGFPDEISFGAKKMYDLRYGENPHQKAAFYRDVLGSSGIASAQQLHGKELSFNNILDADAAWKVASDFREPTVCVIKHTNPCGLASRRDIAEAYRLAYEGDPVSAFGGIVGFNRSVTAEAAQEVAKIFYEIIVAPDYDPEALNILQKKRDLRILKADPKEGTKSWDIRRVGGGLLVQDMDSLQEDPSTWKPVTERQPTRKELADLAFAWRAAKHVKSNAIVLVKDRVLLGMGAGQPNRVTSVHLSLRAAGEKAKGSVLGSDAFFPFPDGVEMAAQGGITAIAQPGGSIRDQDAIATANKYKIAMVFTGVRHFRH